MCGLLASFKPNHTSALEDCIDLFNTAISVQLYRLIFVVVVSICNSVKLYQHYRHQNREFENNINSLKTNSGKKYFELSVLQSSCLHLYMFLVAKISIRNYLMIKVLMCMQSCHTHFGCGDHAHFNSNRELELCFTFDVILSLFPQDASYNLQNNYTGATSYNNSTVQEKLFHEVLSETKLTRDEISEISQ